MHRTAERRADVHAVMPFGTIGDLSRRRVQRRPPVFHRERGPGGRRDRALRLGRRLSRRDRRPAVEARRAAPRGGGRLVRSARLRGHRAGAGAGLRAVRGARMDRQEHVPDQPGARLVDLPGRDHHQPRARARRARPRSVRDVHAVSRGVSDRARWSSRACSTRRAACRISRSSSRARSRSSTATPSAEHAYGCDICQEVCPWNLSPSTGVTTHRAWQPRDGLDGPKLLDLWRRSDDELRALLKGSAMKRAGVTRLRRNLAVAIGNSGDQRPPTRCATTRSRRVSSLLWPSTSPGRWRSSVAEKRPPRSSKPGVPVPDLLPDRPTLVERPRRRGGVQGVPSLQARPLRRYSAKVRGAPRIMLVGEQPGDAEDLAGHPFVGPAGRLLDRALEEAGIDRRTVYLTNVVKHFKWEPRGKRRIHAKPNAAEIAACRPWLETEIALVKPRVLVCLGRDRGPGVARNGVQGLAAARGNRRVAARADRHRDGPSFVDPAGARRRGEAGRDEAVRGGSEEGGGDVAWRERIGS